tara:strand:+ start:257197 stop:258990 length:1794 start_codon:yes stop_codon:yes gene_type:complete
MKKLRHTLPFLAILLLINVKAQETINLWPKGVPDAIEDTSFKEEVQYDNQGKIRGYSKISKPELSIYLADEQNNSGAAVIICPGGGYSHLAIEKEGHKVARWFNSLGISAFVLKYRMPNDRTMKNKSVGPLQDAQEAMRMARSKAKEWKINPDRIGIMGFSAGGHLASTLSTHYNDQVYTSNYTVSARPDFSILVYPVISMDENITHMGSRTNLLGENANAEDLQKYSNEKQVNKQTPPTFLIHTTVDKAVPVENSINYYLALKNNEVDAEMHLYEKGRHGMGLGLEGTNQYWPDDLEHWLRAHEYIAEKETYLFSYFKGNGEDGLHFAQSDDGLKWKTLKNDQSFLTPLVGKDSLMRDPCIIKGGDNKYHMVWTVSWTDRGIGYAYSDDLISWSEQRFIPVMAHEPKARNTWAPEITYDSDTKTYMIYWASTIEGKFPETQSKEESGYNHRMYYVTTKDFKNFSDTQLLYEPGFNVIDSSIKKHGDQFVMFLKDETREPAEKNIKIAYANKLTGPYSAASKPITGNYWAEGPTATMVDGNWVVYFDKYIDHQYGAVRSKDLKEWEDISDQISFPEGTRHGTVLKVPQSVVDKLGRE